MKNIKRTGIVISFNKSKQEGTTVGGKAVDPDIEWVPRGSAKKPQGQNKVNAVSYVTINVD